MKVARIIFPIKVLGPGDRVGIWLAGCPHRCKGCSNPELWDSTTVQDISPMAVIEVVKKITDNIAFGVTITGGEPFVQCEELCLLTKKLLELTDDILVYTGYTLEKLRASGNSYVFEVLNSVAVIIDGKYIEGENSAQPLIGSANQKIHYLKSGFKSVYQEYIANMHGKSLIQNFASNNSVISVGIHSPNFNAEFESRMKMYGLTDKEEIS